MQKDVVYISKEGSYRAFFYFVQNKLSKKDFTLINIEQLKGGKL